MSKRLHPPQREDARGVQLVEDLADVVRSRNASAVLIVRFNDDEDHATLAIVGRVDADMRQAADAALSDVFAAACEKAAR